MIKRLNAAFSQEVALRSEDDKGESGQAIVIIALILLVLLALVGIAVDIGLVYARQSQLSLAVDSSALAGVLELNRDANERQAAINRGAEFLHVNNMPESAVTNTFANDVGLYAFDTASNATTLGARTFSVTGTLPVELYFLRVLGFKTVPVSAKATAAYFPLADMYASRRVEFGALSTSNQAIFGPHIWVNNGDPFSNLDDPPGTGDPRAVAFRDRWHGDPNDRTYHYRILIPPGYEDESDIVRVELFDPDSINRPNNYDSDNNGSLDSYLDTVVHTADTIDTGAVPSTELLFCRDNQINPCLINTGERGLLTPPLTPLAELDRVNLWWFERIDENRGSGTPPGDPRADGAPNPYNVQYNTVTLYELFTFNRQPDGTIIRTPLASYYGQSGDFVPERNGFDRDAAFSSIPDQHTDMHWVTPGAVQASDFDFDGNGVPDVIPTACGSATGGDYDPVTCPGGSVAAPGRGFELSMSRHLQDILVDGSTGNRFVYMDVTTLSGASENGFEVWAGPGDYVNTVSANVNARNVQVINDPSSHSAKGVTVYGIGHLPMNSNVNFAVDIPLIYVGPEYAGSAMYVSIYDSDAGADPPVIFYFDSISEDDWSLTFSDPGVPDPDGVTGRCIIGSCGTQWIDPAYRIDVPSLTDDCTDPNDSAQQDVCTPFYGGRLVARYIGGEDDTYHWNINLAGLPYLIE
ncbi:MAG TPA: pilus assembly protein TadG-related protein [candidate division Zixibacteria bacterium]|nr:pilus assembly protein TadG-related protein [candidate division Zixibacteria bacterium]